VTVGVTGINRKYVVSVAVGPRESILAKDGLQFNRCNSTSVTAVV